MTLTNFSQWSELIQIRISLYNLLISQSWIIKRSILGLKQINSCQSLAQEKSITGVEEFLLRHLRLQRVSQRFLELRQATIQMLISFQIKKKMASTRPNSPLKQAVAELQTLSLKVFPRSSTINFQLRKPVQKRTKRTAKQLRNRRLCSNRSRMMPWNFRLCQTSRIKMTQW